MDNQQTKTHFRLGYLVGMLEGEGCITLVAFGKKGASKITPYISITNTNKIIFDTIVSIIEEHKLPHYIDKRTIKSGRIAYRVVATGQKRTQKWIDLLLPFMRGKCRQMEIISQFNQCRINAGSTFPPKPYTDIERGLWNEVHELNVSSANVPETTRRG